MAVNCYSVATNCVTSSGNRVFQPRNQTLMMPYPATAPLEIAGIDILGQVVRTPRGKNFLLVITDRYFKIVRTVLLKETTPASVAKALTRSWVPTYGPPKWFFFRVKAKSSLPNSFKMSARFYGLKTYSRPPNTHNALVKPKGFNSTDLQV